MENECKEDVKRVYDEGTPILGAKFIRQKFCSHNRVVEKSPTLLYCKDCGADIPK